MSDTPELTLELSLPETEKAPLAPIQPAAEELAAQDGKYMEDVVLSESEQQMVDDFSKKIDLRNSDIVLSTAQPARKRSPISPTPRSITSAPRTWARSGI